MKRVSTVGQRLGLLLVKAMSGDEAAYRQFFSETTPILRRIIARRIESSEIDDVLQEVLLSLHKARHTYDGERPFMPWLVAITNYRITDALRRHYGHKRQQMIDISEVEHMLAADVTNDSSSDESFDELLQDVPEKQRKMLTMMYVEGYTAKEVATRMGMKESAVKVAAHRVIKKLREKSI